MTPSDQSRGADVLVELAGRVAAYDPRQSLDNRADEMPLDLAIAKAFGVAEDDWQIARGSVTGYFSGDGVGGFGNPTVPRYTRSLDAALSLVPAEYDFQITAGWADPIEAVVAHHLAARNDHIASAATSALALTAACLLARAHGDTRS